MPTQPLKRGGRRGKPADKRPARDRYWARGQLRKHKIDNLVRCAKMTVDDAAELWDRTRKGRKR